MSLTGEHQRDDGAANKEHSTRHAAMAVLAKAASADIARGLSAVASDAASAAAGRRSIWAKPP
jgi:hypothetical protein